MPKKQTGSNESAQLPKRNRGPLLLRLTADMFRQHSDLYLQHAAILERISANPESPESWMLEEPTPENIAARIRQEETTTLALKTYDGMLQVQKRVDHMERLMSRNGISKHKILASRKPSKSKKRKVEDPCTAFYWFFREHSMRIEESLKQAGSTVPVRTEVQRIWKLQNALERKPYIQKAQHVTALKTGSVLGAASLEMDNAEGEDLKKKASTTSDTGSSKKVASLESDKKEEPCSDSSRSNKKDASLKSNKKEDSDSSGSSSSINKKDASLKSSKMEESDSESSSSSSGSTSSSGSNSSSSSSSEGEGFLFQPNDGKDHEESVGKGQSSRVQESDSEFSL